MNSPEDPSATVGPGGRRIAFGCFALDPSTGTLLKHGQVVPLGKRGMSLLTTLANRLGEAVTKNELLSSGWHGVIVEESNLSVQIALLRKALGLSPSGQEWIETIPRVGYRFNAFKSSHIPIVDEPLEITLAILPFTAQGEGHDAVLFADGLTEELLTTLSKVSGISAAARISSFAYRDITKDARQISLELQSRYLIDGRVRRQGERVRITVELIDGRVGKQLWTERYERDFSHLFALQYELARKMAVELVTLLNPVYMPLWPSISARGTNSIEAYRCFQRGRVLQRSASRTPAIYSRCKGLFQTAIELDPDYASAYAALAASVIFAFHNRWAEAPDASLEEAYKLVDHAIFLDPRDPYIRSVAALVAMYGLDLQRWAFEAAEALSLDSNFAPALSLKAILSLCVGEPSTAIDDLLRAISLDPLFTHNYLHDLGIAYLVCGRYEEAESALQERLLLVPEADATRAYLASALGNLGRFDEARKVWNDLSSVNPKFCFEDRTSTLPFRNQEHPQRIAQGLVRAGLPSPPFLQNYIEPRK